MKRYIFYILSVLTPMLFMGSTLTLSPFACFNESEDAGGTAAELRGDIDKEFNTAKGKTLSVDLKTGGSLEITGWNKNTVHVKALLDGYDAEEINLNMRETSSGVSISTDYFDSYDNDGDFRLVINVPDEYDLELETMGGGIKIKNIKGEFNGKTMGGGLDLSNLKGEIDLTTMGGDIIFTDSDIDGRVHTMGGRVTLENVTGDVKGTSMGGNVTLKNVTKRNGDSTRDKVVISSMGGDIDVQDAPAGAEVTTMGGDIKIESAAKFINAKTMGGDISVKSVDGGIKATTMAGDVNVKVTGSNDGDKDVDLTSMGGDIYLYVPAGFSMDIDISLAYTKNHEGDFKIISDFDLKEEVSGKWYSGKGSDRKYIKGKGVTGDGRHKIHIETINGNVYLKRG